MISLGLDIGSNSVGSAWVDTDARVVDCGVTIFPAGVDETEMKRGTPLGQKRREKRSQRRSLRRRADRKRVLRGFLIERGLLPPDAGALAELMNRDPWLLRRDALHRALSPHEFGRVLVHLNQRRGAAGVLTDPDDKEEGAVKEAIDHTRHEMLRRYAAEGDDRQTLASDAAAFGQWAKRHRVTFGQFIADLSGERRAQPLDEDGRRKKGKFYGGRVRNRRDTFEFHADRQLIRDEFHILWEAQKAMRGELSELLTDELRGALDQPAEDDVFRHKGLIFGQRRTYWDTGMLGRCDLEPTDQRCPLADMHAQRFRVIETVNNIRIEERGQPERPLTPEERDKVMAALRKQKTGSPATIRKALGIDKKAVKAFYSLNVEKDADREINTDWFYREIVLGAFGETAWNVLPPAGQDSVNRAILKFDPDKAEHAQKLKEGAGRWWNLSDDAAERFVRAWRGRPNLEKRVKLSRKAILNLLPYMSAFDVERNRWPTQIDARQGFAEDGANGATAEQRARYALAGLRLTKGERHFMRKHGRDATGNPRPVLPPAPVMANPVVRKAIHEVRRHVMAYLGKYGKAPDRIVIELARSATQPEIRRNKVLAENRKREAERKKIIAEFTLGSLSETQQNRAVERVMLCRQQKGICPYTALHADGLPQAITERQAAEGTDVEIDHIIPLSRSQDNGLNNKALCYRASNRTKGSRTPREWLSPEQFARLEQRLGFLRQDLPRKWDQLHREPLPEEKFINSQLSDSAYAANEVAAYLRNTLYGGETDGTRRVFFTKGKYTAMLRRDWQLFQSEGVTAASEEGADGQTQPREKNRGDHRHHGIDAVVIALTGPDIIKDIARDAAYAEDYHVRTGFWPRRKPMPPPKPWPDVEVFRREVLSRFFAGNGRSESDGPLVVAHRPTKRKLTGALHEETAYGPVLGANTNFTNRIRAYALTSNHLRLSEQQRQAIAAGGRPSAKDDPPPAKSGIVRDLALRVQIRECLAQNGIDPDDFAKDQMKALTESDKLRMRSSVPIRSVILLRTIADPVVMRRKRWDDALGRFVYDDDPRALRVYIGGNNHHVEIRENEKTGKWSGEVVTAFTAARRVRPPRNPDGSRGRPMPAVDRADRSAQQFVVSLSEGETIHACRNDRDRSAPDAVGYYVVVKLDKERIFFAPTWDARPADQQDRWDCTFAGLRECGPVQGNPPVKVRVSPLGQVKELIRD